MSKYIDSDKLVAEIERHIKHYEELDRNDFKNGELYICQELLSFVTSLQQEQPDQPEVDLEKLKNKAELIANGIMMGVQANKYHTCIYDKTSNDFNHSHLLRAALKGIELGLNIRKEY